MWQGASPSAVVNGAAGMTIAALLIMALYFGRDLLIPLATAGILSFILAPSVRRLAGWGMPQGPSVAIVVAALLVCLFAGATFTGRQIASLVEELPRHEANLRDKARFVHFAFAGSGIWQQAAATIRNIEDEVRDPQTESKPVKIEVAQDTNPPFFALFEYTRSSLPSLATAGLALILTIFMLLEYGDLRDRIVRLMGPAQIGRSTQLIEEAGSDLAHFLFLQSGLNASFGIFVGGALWAIGVPSPGLWGVLAAIMRFVPYVGSFLAAVFPLALAAMVDAGWWMLVETAAVFVIGEPLVGQIIEPFLFGTQTRLSPIAVLLSAVFWTLLWGPVGLILAVPLTLSIAVLGQHMPRLEFMRILLGNEPALTPPQQLYNRLLVGDAMQAAKDADHWLGKNSLVSYLDAVVIPSLRIASDDQNRSILGRQQRIDLAEAIDEYIQLVKEALDYKCEQLAATNKPAAHRRNVMAVIIAGRGILDHAASELVADAIRLYLGISVQCPSLGGLTAISAAAQASDDERPDIVVLISVGAVTPPQLNLLQQRTRRHFSQSDVVVGCWGQQHTGAQRRDADPDSLHFAASAKALIELIGRIADERNHTALDRRPAQLITQPLRI